MECLNRNAPPAEQESFRRSERIIRTGKCSYSGALAVGGSINFAIPGVMDEQTDLWCEPCRRDLAEFASRPENKIPDFPFDDEAAQERLSKQSIDRALREREFIRQRIEERTKRRPGRP